MKKKLLRFVCTSLLTVMCGSVNAQATNGSCGTNATWEYDSGTLTISGTGAITTYSTTQPTEYPWYSQKANIQFIIINEGITNIPDWAFAEYGDCVSIKLPSTLKSIGNSALEECGFGGIYLPEGLETIGDYAFLGDVFRSICLPSTIKSIGSNAFNGCATLEDIGCYATTPPALAADAFYNCNNMANIYVPSATIATYQGASNWNTFSAIIKSPGGNCGPDGYETKATWTFEMATRTLTITGTEIGNTRPWDSDGMGSTGGAFNPDNNVGYPCGIENIVIGEGIEEIPGMAFYMEVGLATITLPSSLTKINVDAFGECLNVSSIISNAMTPPTLGDVGYENNAIYGGFDPNTYDPLAITTMVAIYVPSANVNDYKAAAGWNTYLSKITASPLSYSGGQYTFTRSGLTAGTHSTICLPFDYEKPASCSFYEFTGVAKNGSGEWEATFTALAGNPVANTPYIFTCTATSLNITRTTGAVDYSATNPKKTVDNWVFQGTYKPIGWLHSPKGYYGYAGQATATAQAGQFVHLVSGASAAPFRAYLKCTDTSHELYKTRGTDEENAAETDLPQTIKVVLVDSFGDTTTIGTIDTRTGEMILDGDTWYSLDGKKLISKPTKKGVYINNGKTVLVK